MLRYECITVVIYFIFVQYMKHRMQTTQERSKYDLMTNSVKFMQKRVHHCQKVTAVFVTTAFHLPDK